MIKNSVNIVPSAVTSANMFFGFLAIIKTMNGQFITAGWLIIIAAVMDGLDGKIARLVDKDSKFGKEFDSLSDLVSFGVAPAILAYKAYLERFEFLGVVIVFLFALCGALRLARFNVSDKPGKKNMFTGLPIPVAAVTVASFIHLNSHFWDEMRLGVAFIILILLVCFLMVSTIKYDKLPRLTFKDSKQNLTKLIFMAGGLILIAFFPSIAFFPICLIFIIWGIVRSIVKSLKKVAVQEVNETR